MQAAGPFVASAAIASRSSWRGAGAALLPQQDADRSSELALGNLLHHPHLEASPLSGFTARCALPIALPPSIGS
jgi:hypothetical protein